ncbi:hypothetical protein CC78DRAFT_487941, partial [Lojkania enalia]
MVSRFDPVLRSNCKLTQVPYFPPEVAAAEDDILEPYGYPTGLWSRFNLEVCKLGRSRREERRKYPVALFSAGLNTTRLFSSGLAQEISSHGFIVITVDHPYDTDIVVFPNGDVIYGGRVIKPADMNGSTASVERALEIRAQDESFVLDTLGFKKYERTAVFGHSFGGAAAATTMLNDKRFRAGINIDGMMFGPVLNVSLGSLTYPQAFMLWGSDGHDSLTDPSWTAFWNMTVKGKHVDYEKEFTVRESAHGSYWDLNLLVDVAEMRESLSELAQLLIGPIPGARVYEILGKYVTSFFWYALGLKPEDEVLKGENGEFPEVVLL